MDTSKIIDTYGNLLKAEELVTMTKKILPNTFVLEAPEPFPGFFNYYSDAPGKSKPLYIYFVVDRLYTLEEITRARQNIMRYFPDGFHADAGTLSFYNKSYHTIRVRHLTDYDQVRDLQSCFLDEGIVFKKKPSKNISATAIIRLKKFFCLEEVQEGIYLDRSEKDHGYFTLPRQLKWSEFEEVTKKVKYNWEATSFDAALGHFHKDFNIVDMVRVFNPNLNVELILEARKKYLQQIK
ncbi:hypothetical protein [Saccharicrinis aurantiacus]|uniref:hypothetical protein n=1 Tax=Saccharicrinis aurantiacus TaxID=1849719 RepID=UPI0008395ABD|nr:hypothetical protein [Saccharicrinis aurantiacus]